MRNDTLRLTEIFYSLQGETDTLGFPTVFVRLTGCPLRCQYCDTEYAFHGGTVFSFAEILNDVDQYQAKCITVTGGEPLAQPNCRALLGALCDRGYRVSLETSGAMPINDIDERVSIVLDLKTPASMESHRNLYENLPLLKKNDQIKFVICHRDDYEWARFKLDEYALYGVVNNIFFSPSFDQLKPVELADWIINDRLQVRFQLQLHKILWHDEPGR